jgi:hypothetical protein
MKRGTKRFVLVAACVVVLGATAAALAVAGDPFEGAKPATARFHDVDKAVAAGWSFELPDTTGDTCISEPGVGGMGVHMVNTSLLDGKLDPDEPEALVYEKRQDGTLKLGAVEYVIFQSDWHGAKAPELFGQPFALIPSPNRFGLPAFYALHAWLWKPNPSGTLAMWNPRVTCN